VLLHIMAHGHHEGRDERDPAVRALFTRESLVASEWYRRRLAARQAREVELWTRHLGYLELALAEAARPSPDLRGVILQRRALARAELDRVSTPAHLDSLVGTIGA
jgi:hypothetical protein